MHDPRRQLYNSYKGTLLCVSEPIKLKTSHTFCDAYVRRGTCFQAVCYLYTHVGLVVLISMRLLCSPNKHSYDFFLLLYLCT